MVESIFERLASFMSKKSAVQRVAEDPALAAELLLYLQLIFADGEQHPGEIAAFRAIALEKFGIPADELLEVTDYIKDFAYETTTKQAANIIAEQAPERRLAALADLLKIACADAHIDEKEAAVLKRVAVLLNVTPDELQQVRLLSRQGAAVQQLPHNV